MGDLTKNISKHELKCKCGRCNVTILPYEEVIEVVQGACDYFARLHNVDKVTCIITSAARCYEYNRRPVNIGGPGSNDNSQHPRANAIDFKIKVNGAQIPTMEVHNYLCTKYPDKFGFGVYNSFNHADTRRLKGRWNYQTSTLR